MAATDQRPLGALLADIAGQIQQVLRGEVQLAKAETVQSLVRLKAGATLLGVATTLAILGVTYLLLAAIFLLSTKMPLWSAALIVSAAVLVLAGGCAVGGLREVRKIRGVPRTVRSIRETMQWPT